MKYFLLTTIATGAMMLFPFTTVTAQEPDSPPTYSVEKTGSQIQIDGKMLPGEWENATRVQLRYEIDPGENIKPKVHTTAYLTYDKHNLYIAFIAEDPSPADIRANISDRDTAWRDDFVGIVIDPFNDSRRGYEFFVNPYGVQMDMKRVEGRGEDSSWDTIWESAGAITDTGYTVEFAIPFRSISFPNGTSVHTWGFWFFRAYPRDFRYQISNVPFDRNKNCFFCQVSRVNGFEGIHPGRNLEINPTMTATKNNSRDGFGEPMNKLGTITGIGLNLRWAPTSNITVNAALNPDFSQVEADSAQLSFNRQFSLFFEEKRPFFLEGADIFQTHGRFVHTRTISDPSYGLKASGKSGPYAWGFFNAKDTITNILLPGAMGSSYASWDHTSSVSVGRIRKDILKNSTIGVLVTNRSGGDYHNTLVSVDGRISFTDSDTVEFQLTTTDTKNPDDPNSGELNGENLSGNAYTFAFDHEDRNWDISLWQTRKDRGFRADIGFVPQVDYVTSGIAIDHTIYGKDGAFISRIRPGIESEIQKDTAGNVLHRTFHLDTNIRMSGQSYLGFFYDMEMRYYEGINHYFGNYGFWAGGRLKKLAWNSSGFLGENVDYANNRLGDWKQLDVQFTWFANSHIQFEANVEREEMREMGQDLFTANVLQGRFVYNFSTRMYVRTLLQYTTLEQNPALYDDLDTRISRSLFPQILFSYKINPRTLLYLGYSGSRAATELNPMESFQRTFFFKVAYAWRL